MYDALDEYEVNQMPDEVWQTLLDGKVHATDIKHNYLVSLKKMELVRQDAKGFIYLTNQGAVYASMIIHPAL